MDFIKMLRENNGLSDLLCDVCDIKILPKFKTPEDGSIGFWGSEGACGRIADNLQEFFEFVINCPYWQDYLDEDKYQHREKLREFAREVYEKQMENDAEKRTLWTF